MGHCVSDAIEGVEERYDVSAEFLLYAIMEALVQAYRHALARDPSPVRPAGEQRNAECYDRALEDLQKIATWQQSLNADRSAEHARESARFAAAGNVEEAQLAEFRATGRDNLAVAQSAMGDLFDACHDMAMLEAGLQPVVGTLASLLEDCSWLGGNDDDRPPMRLAV